MPTPAPQPFESFYNLCSTAIWELFTSGHMTEDTRYDYDLYMDSFDGRHVIAICAGTFQETSYGTGTTKSLTINDSEWKVDCHEEIEVFFADMDDLINEYDLSGVTIVDRKKFMTLEITEPHNLLALIGHYLDKFDIYTVDDITPEDLSHKPSTKSTLPPHTLARQLRRIAKETFGCEFSVKPRAQESFVDIRYFPITMSPTIDTADIALINARSTLNVAPFSYDLLENTYRDCCQRRPLPYMGLALLH